MTKYLVFGMTYGLAAAVQPGQLQAYLISRAVANGWRRTLPGAFAPLLSDLPVVALVLLVLTQVPPLFVAALRLAGGVFLLYLALGALRAWRAGGSTGHRPPAGGSRTLMEAATLNLLNPNPYLGWALVLGPWLLEAWAQSAASALALVAAFYATLVGGSAAIVLLFAMARSLGPRVTGWLVAASAAALGAFGVYQLWAGAVALL